MSVTDRRLKVVVCWLGLQGYAAACFRALSRIPSIDLHVIYLDLKDMPEQEELLDGLSNQCVVADAPDAAATIAESVVAQSPDVVYLCGWFYSPYRALLDRKELRKTTFMLGMDPQWTGSWRQRLNIVRLRSFIRRMDLIVAAGTRGAEFARRLSGVSAKTVTGFNGFDFERFRQAGQARARAGWPRRFLFAGRYVPVKGLDVLMQAYAMYRSHVTNPWALHCCGSGTDAPLLRGQPGVEDLGYQLPTRLPELFAGYGTFVMPSRVEPWGVAIAEALATGMPVICTDVCGAAADVVRPYYNGVVIPPDDVEALCRALTWIHQHEDRLATMGEHGQALVHPFGAAAWADRMHVYINTAIARRTS